MTFPELDLRPVSVVLGAAGGIGSCLCRRLKASLDARLILFGRTREKLDLLAHELDGQTIIGDATNFEQVEKMMEEATNSLGRVDGIANCVGSILLKSAHLTTFEDYQATISANLGSAFGVVRAAGKHMGVHGGSVVLFSSAAARVGLPNHEAIAAAKGAIEALVRSASATYAGRNIRFNAVAPGLVETPLSSRITSNEASLKASLAMHPLGRIGAPSDIASAAEFFLKPQNSWITGQVLGIDGGLADLKGRA
jgi:NAD(P)-dependent dehydrogenase (short-subunit alcohol dehydrogenase family)